MQPSCGNIEKPNYNATLLQDVTKLRNLSDPLHNAACTKRSKHFTYLPQAALLMTERPTTPHSERPI
jgi:hypothetical protein